MRKQRDQQQFANLLLCQPAHRVPEWMDCWYRIASSTGTVTRSCNFAWTLRLVTTSGEPSCVQIFS